MQDLDAKTLEVADPSKSTPVRLSSWQSWQDVDGVVLVRTWGKGPDQVPLLEVSPSDPTFGWMVWPAVPIGQDVKPLKQGTEIGAEGQGLADAYARSMNWRLSEDSDLEEPENPKQPFDLRAIEQAIDDNCEDAKALWELTAPLVDEITRLQGQLGAVQVQLKELRRAAGALTEELASWPMSPFVTSLVGTVDDLLAEEPLTLNSQSAFGSATRMGRRARAPRPSEVSDVRRRNGMNGDRGLTITMKPPQAQEAVEQAQAALEVVCKAVSEAACVPALRKEITELQDVAASDKHTIDQLLLARTRAMDLVDEYRLLLMLVGVFTPPPGWQHGPLVPMQEFGDKQHALCWSHRDFLIHLSMELCPDRIMPTFFRVTAKADRLVGFSTNTATEAWKYATCLRGAIETTGCIPTSLDADPDIQVAVGPAVYAHAKVSQSAKKLDRSPSLNRVREARLAKGVTLGEAARFLGCSTADYSAMELGRTGDELRGTPICMITDQDAMDGSGESTDQRSMAERITAFTGKKP